MSTPRGVPCWGRGLLGFALLGLGSALLGFALLGFEVGLQTVVGGAVLWAFGAVGRRFWTSGWLGLGLGLLEGWDCPWLLLWVQPVLLRVYALYSRLTVDAALLS